MRFLWIGARKEATVVRRDPFSLIIPIGIPLVLAILMNMVFGGKGEATPHGLLLIADEDQSIASSLLAGAFGREPLSNMLQVRQVNRTAGRSRVDRGEASALLIVPKGLQDAVLANRPARLELFTNPAERIVPKVVEEALAMVMDGAFYLQKIAGPQLRSLSGAQSPSDQAVIASSLATKRLVDGMGRYLSPPLIQLESRSVTPQKTFNFAALFFPCMIFMSLMLLANSLAGEIWKERTAGTLRRLAATPVPISWYLAGRLLWVMFVLFCVGLVGVTAVRAMSGVPVASTPGAIAWVMLSGGALYLCLLFLVMHAQSPRTANIMGNLVIFPLCLIGGTFFPFEIMPAWMVSVGRLTPNGWAVMQFRAILEGSARAGSLMASAAGLAMVGAAAFVLSARRLRGGFLL